MAEKVLEVQAQLLDAELAKSFIVAEADCLKQAIKELEGKLSLKKKRKEAEKRSQMMQL